MSHDYPHFLIVGFMKAATTTVFDHLVSHPGVHAPIAKELHYFSREHVPNYNPSFFGLEYHEQLRYADSQGRLCGEASPSYIMVASRIASFNPNTKIVILLRDPVERALSQYRQYRQYDLFTDELQDIDKRELDTLNIVRDSCYYEHVQEFLISFPAQNVLLVSFEEFCSRQHDAMKEIFLFLNLVPMAVSSKRLSVSERFPDPPGLRDKLTDYFKSRRGRIAQLIAQRGPRIFPNAIQAFERY